MEIKKQTIEYIKILPNYLIIKIFKQKLYVAGEEENINNVKKLLLESNYKKFITT